VAYTDPAEGGTSGLYFVGILDRFGIADEIKKKSVLTKGGREAALEVAEGRAEIGVTFISEILAVKGAKLAARVPEALQDYTVYAAASRRAAPIPPMRAPSSACLRRRRWRDAGRLPVSSRRNKSPVWAHCLPLPGRVNKLYRAISRRSAVSNSVAFSAVIGSPKA
jgi:hypothetical protein